jgi:hypothetical protein
LKELETHLLLAGRVGFASAESIQLALGLSESVGKPLRLLIRRLSEN